MCVFLFVHAPHKPSSADSVFRTYERQKTTKRHDTLAEIITLKWIKLGYSLKSHRIAFTPLHYTLCTGTSFLRHHCAHTYREFSIFSFISFGFLAFVFVVFAVALLGLPFVSCVCSVGVDFFPILIRSSCTLIAGNANINSHSTSSTNTCTKHQNTQIASRFLFRF